MSTYCPSFQFSQLPKDIRLMIWYLCLPRRVIDFTYPRPTACYHEAGQKCRLRQATGAACILPPLIGLVCKESREVVLANGHLWDEHIGSEVYATFWWQPDIDVLHLNWRGWCSVPRDRGDIYRSELPYFLSIANKGKHAPLSLSYILINTFLSTPSYYNLPYHTRNFAHNPCLENMQALANASNCSHSIVVKTIILHIREEDALESSLFGMFGEELVQMVDITDTERIRAYYELWASRALDDNSIPKGFEALVSNPVFETFQILLVEDEVQNLATEWRKRVAIKLLTAVWVKARAAGFQGIENPEAVWTPLVQPDEEPQQSVHTLNDNHPWVKSTRAGLPVLDPKIMFRCCLDQACLSLAIDPTVMNFFSYTEDPFIPLEI